MGKFLSLKSGVSRTRFADGELRQTKLFEIAPEAKKLFPFYFKLPYDDPIALLRWRIYVRKRCVHDLVFRNAVWQMAAQDVAFFSVTFAVIFEPRPLPRSLPFHLWTDQVSLLAWFTEIFGERSGGVNKTRGIGLSWLTSLFMFHKWLFVDQVTMAGLTKDKDLLESQNANSLMGKFQFLFDNLPTWAKFTPEGKSLMYRVTENHMIINVANGASIQGFVSTSTKLRQLRFTFIFADEFAFYDRTDQHEWMVSAGGCSNSRLMVSTWNDFCLGGDTLVLTDAGVKQLKSVDLQDHLWDGNEWVSHEGLTYSGDQKTIFAYGAWMTPEHKVLTNRGWQNAKENLEAAHVNPPREWEAYRRVCELGAHDTAVPKSEERCVGLLWGSRDTSVQTVAGLHELSKRHGRPSCRQNAGPHGNRRQLRAGELPVGDSPTAGQQHAGQRESKRPQRIPTSGASRGIAKHDSHSPTQRVHSKRVTIAEPAWRTQPVYDLHNAGPRHCFTIVSSDGRLVIVHNSDIFHHVMYEEETSMLKMEAFWWNNYERWQGAYYMQNGRPVLADHKYKHTEGYPFGAPDLIDDGMLRSPWVDAELSKPGIDPMKALRDLYGMSVCERSNAFFDKHTKDAVFASQQEPGAQGTLDVSTGTLKILPTLKSDIRVWDVLDKDTGIVKDVGPFTMACDLAHGYNADYSVCQVLDRTGSQVLEYARKDQKISDFAHACVHIARWLAGENGDGYVLLDFESNGPLNKPFTAELKRCNYSNIHYSRPKLLPGTRIKTSTLPDGDVPKYAGTNNRDGGLGNFKEFERAVMALELRVRSINVHTDMRLMGKDVDTGSPVFPKKRREGHGDFIHAIAMAWWRGRARVGQEVLTPQERSDGLPWERGATSARWSDQFSRN